MHYARAGQIGDRPVPLTISQKPSSFGCGLRSEPGTNTARNCQGAKSSARNQARRFFGLFGFGQARIAIPTISRIMVVSP